MIFGIDYVGPRAQIPKYRCIVAAKKGETRQVLDIVMENNGMRSTNVTITFCENKEEFHTTARSRWKQAKARLQPGMGITFAVAQSNNYEQITRQVEANIRENWSQLPDWQPDN